MTNFARMAALGVALAGLALTATPAAAAPQGVVTGAKPQAKARIIKPLVLKRVRDLDFQTIVMGSVAAAGETVSISAAGALSCGTGGLTCSGTVQTARYNVVGTQGQTIHVTSNTSTLTGSNGGSLTFTPAVPADFTMSNSGATGDNFDVGGSITIMPTTTDGLYSGDMEVFVDYL